MKINDANLVPAETSPSLGRVSSPNPAGAYSQTGVAGYGSAPDQVQLSGASRIASAALAAHAARVTELRSLIASDQYNPPSQAVSEAVVGETLARSAAFPAPASGPKT